MLRGQRIRFSPIHALNDPFEMKPHLSAVADRDYILEQARRSVPQVLETELAKLPPSVRSLLSEERLAAFLSAKVPQTAESLGQTIASFMPSIRETLERRFGDLLGILCLSETADNLPMWAHYADSHRGFVVGFDETSPFFDCRVSPTDDLRHVRRVEYSLDRPSLTLVELNSFRPFLTKGTDWAYEREWRMVRPLDDASHVVGNGTDAVHLFDFPAQALTSVILGCRMSEAKRAEIRSILQSDSSFGHVRCIQAELDARHYRVTVA